LFFISALHPVIAQQVAQLFVTYWRLCDVIGTSTTLEWMLYTTATKKSKKRQHVVSVN